MWPCRGMWLEQRHSSAFRCHLSATPSASVQLLVGPISSCLLVLWLHRRPLLLAFDHLRRERLVHAKRAKLQLLQSHCDSGCNETVLDWCIIAMSDVAPEDVRSNKTAYLAAYSFGLSAPQSEISMAWHAWKAVDPGIVHGKKRRSEGQAALDRLAQQPELEFLPHCLREWCHLRA
eukprot:353303-Chlamydomonas_euryale.AAC.1